MDPAESWSSCLVGFFGATSVFQVPSTKAWWRVGKEWKQPCSCVTSVFVCSLFLHTPGVWQYRWLCGYGYRWTRLNGETRARIRWCDGSEPEGYWWAWAGITSGWMEMLIFRRVSCWRCCLRGFAHIVRQRRHVCPLFQGIAALQRMG